MCSVACYTGVTRSTHLEGFPRLLRRRPLPSRLMESQGIRKTIGKTRFDDVVVSLSLGDAALLFSILPTGKTTLRLQSSQH